MEILKCENLRKVYGSGNNQVVALDHIDLSVQKGEFVANLPRAVKGKKAQKKEKHDFREKGIAKQASTLRRPRNIEITINL